MATIRAADGGYLLNSEQFNYTKDAQGRPVLNVVGGGGGTVTESDIENALGYKPIGADDVPVKSVNGATGEVKSTFYVTVTQGDDGSVTADKTAAEVYAAYEAGYAVYAIAKFKGAIVPYTLPLLAAVRVSGMVMIGFATIGTSNPNVNPQGLVVLYNGAAWSAWSDTLAKIQDIPEGVPPFTAADNDKVLGIVNGELAWVAKA